MSDKLIKIVQELEDGDIRRIDGMVIDKYIEPQRKYQYKAFKISSPHDLIRIDLRRIK